MIDTAYNPQIVCEVSEGILGSGTGLTVCVEDSKGNKQYLQASQGMINQVNDSAYLPVGIVRVDQQQRLVLIELPSEADSGVNRMWVRFDSLRPQEKG